LNSPTVTIGASGIDTAAIEQAAREAVKQKQQAGIYAAAGLDGKKRINPLEFKNDDEFLTFYLESLREASFVDISDFEIEEKRTRFRGFFLRLKRTIWNLLKFYTYRLWSQQNQVNGLLLSGMEGIYERQQSEIAELKKRISELEKKLMGTNDS